MAAGRFWGLGVHRPLNKLQELASGIQVGAKRAPIKLELVPTAYQNSEETKLLVEFATVELMRRAGALPRQGLMPVEFAPTDEVVANSAAPLLEQALAEELNAVLEWVSAASEKGLKAPYSVLPSFLSAPKNILRKLIPVLGARGNWLAELMGVELEDSERSFRDIAEKDAEDYRTWLASQLDDFEWQQRAEALSCLTFKFRSEDIGLLERGLADKRKEVREVAYGLLAQIPDSKQAQEINQLAKEALTVSKTILRRELIVKPIEPSSLPKELPQIGKRSQLGPMETALLEVLRFTPPQFWITQSGLSPQDILALAERTIHKNALFFGWLEASLRFDDQRWIDAIFLSGEFDQILIGHELWPGAIRRASETLVEEVVVKSLVRGSFKQVLQFVALHRQRVLPLEASQIIIKNIHGLSTYEVPWKELAYTLDTRVLPFPNLRSDIDPSFIKPWEKLRHIIELRSKLLQTLKT